MKIAIIQPYFLPYIGYYQIVNHVDKFIIYDDVNYINKGWINRNRIVVNDNEYLFTIPLINASQNKIIKDICISGDLKWKNKLTKSIELSYKKASMFKDVFPIIEEIIYFNENNLSSYIYQSIKRISEYLEIDTEIVPSSERYNNSNLKSQSRIIDICMKENADIYVNPVGGVSLYNKDEFKANNIDLVFHKSRLTPYKNDYSKYIAGLSIIDLLMHNDRKSLKENLVDFELF